MPRRVRVAALAVAVATGMALGCAADEVAAPDIDPRAPLRQKVLAHEELIADCMQALGFDYVAALPSDILLEEARASAEAAGEDVEAAVDALDLPANPNDETLEGLARAEQVAWEDAFYGRGDGTDGCYYSTYEQAWGVDPADLDVGTDDELAEAERRIAEHPDVIAAEAAFLGCMAAEGFAVGSVDDARSFVARREEQVVDQIEAAGRTDIRPDDPLWVAYETEIAAYQAAFEPCEGDLLAVVQPIENRLLAGAGGAGED